MEVVKLGTLTSRKIGYGIVQPGENRVNGVPVIKVNNLISGLRNVNDLDKTSEENDLKYSRTKLVGGELVISVVGTIGKTAIVPKEFAGCNLVRATAMIDILDPLMSLWVKYYIDSPKAQHYIKENLNTTVQPTLNVKSLVEMPIPLFSMEEMECIVKILKSLDDKIEVNRRINDNLEQQAQALFKSWFVDFEPFRDQPFVESELGMIPEGWKVGNLGELVYEIESGSRPKGGAEIDGVPSIGAEKIERFGIYDFSGEKYINNDYYAKMKRGHVKDGDVLLYKDGAYTGKTSLALDGYPYNECAVNEHVFLLRTKSSQYQFYLYYLMSYPEIRTMIHTLASAKAAQPGLNQKELLGLNISMPSEGIIRQFNNLLSSNMHQIANRAKESRRLAELRDTLLPKLMSGELKVTNMDLVNEMLEKGIR